MPVIDGVFVARSPLTPAELHVDFLAHNQHILDRRRIVERAATPETRRLVLALQNLTPVVFAAPPLAARLERHLAATARYGFNEARREIAAARKSAPLLPVTAAARPIPDAGDYAEVATGGLVGVLALVKLRAAQAAVNIAEQIMRALTLDTDPTRGLLLATKAATRALHNNVLDLVGETLNLGRSAGALTLETPPEFALRSEQLDKNTCSVCFGLHGTITRVGSPEYFAVMPPTGCLGGGRCRALTVFGDRTEDVRLPVAA